MNTTERLNKHVAELQTQLDKTFESTELPSAARPYFNEVQRARKMLLEEYKSCLSSTDTLSAISALFPDDAPHKHPETGVSLLDDVRDVIEATRPRYITDSKGSIVYTLPLPLRCIFCAFKGTLEELRQHSAVCPEHPAVKQYRYQASDMRREEERYKQNLDTASHQMNYLKGINESLLKAMAEPLLRHIPPTYIMKSDSGIAVAATKALDVLSAVNHIGAISWNQELKRSVEDAIAELRKTL